MNVGLDCLQFLGNEAHATLDSNVQGIQTRIRPECTAKLGRDGRSCNDRITEYESVLHPFFRKIANNVFQVFGLALDSPLRLASMGRVDSNVTLKLR